MMNPEVDTYLENLNKWQKELTKLRDIILTCGLDEGYKWMHPCYTYKGKNIVLIHKKKLASTYFYKLTLYYMVLICYKQTKGHSDSAN